MAYSISYMHSPSHKTTDERRMQKSIDQRNAKAQRKLLRQQKRIREYGKGKISPPQKNPKDVKRISEWTKIFLLMSLTSRASLIIQTEKTRESLLSTSDAIFGKINYEIHLMKEALKKVQQIETNQQRTTKRKTLKELSQQKKSTKQQLLTEKKVLKNIKNREKDKEKRKVDKYKRTTKYRKEKERTDQKEIKCQRTLQIQVERESLKATKLCKKQTMIKNKALKKSQRSRRNAFLLKIKEEFL